MSAQQLEAILQMAAQNPPPPQATPAQLRAWFDASNSRMPLAQGLPIQTLRIPNGAGGTMAAELLSTPQADPRRLVIYYHAGGFVFGSLTSHRALCSSLAQFTGAQVLNVDYRLAPAHPAPAAHDDALAAYQWALANGYAASAIALMGDSAGGNLALSTAVRARNQGLPPPPGGRPPVGRRLPPHPPPPRASRPARPPPARAGGRACAPPSHGLRG